MESVEENTPKLFIKKNKFKSLTANDMIKKMSKFLALGIIT